MKQVKTTHRLCLLLAILLVAAGLTRCKKDEDTESQYAVYLNRADEDFIDFGTFEGFTTGTDWCIIEKVKLPAGTGSQGGWHFFRGKAWEDKEGDIAISIAENRVYAWCRKNMEWVDIAYVATFNEDQWYTICLQYDATEELLELYVDGERVGEQALEPMDDSNNNNRLFWGGQEVDNPDLGDLYSETSIIIAHQAWLQRKLSGPEITAYDGYLAPEPALFFGSEIRSESVADMSGNGRQGANGNTPEFIVIGD